jgi:hypothetical protein
METVLEWAEKAGAENIRFRLANAETLAKDASNLLTMTLAGMSVCLGFALSELKSGGFSVAVLGAAFLTVWLSGAAWLLLANAILARDLPMPVNEPANLYQKEFDLVALREVELDNLQTRIHAVTAINGQVAGWIDRTRIMLAFSPVIALVGAGVGMVAG